MRRFAPGVLVVLLGVPARPSCAASSVVEGIDVGYDEVRIRTDLPSAHREFFLDDPPRLVVELRDAVPGPGVRPAVGRGRWLKGVRAGRFQTEPALTRVVLDLEGRPLHRVVADGAKLTILLGGRVPALAETSPAPTDPAIPTPPPPPAPPTPGAPVRRAPAVPLPSEGAAGGLRWTWEDGVAAGAAGLLFASLLLRLRGARPRPSRPEEEPEAEPPPAADAAPSETARPLQATLNALSRRLAVLERKVDEIGPAELSANHEPLPAELREELAEVRTLVRSVVRTLQQPPGGRE